MSCWTMPATESPCATANSIQLNSYESPDLKSKITGRVDRKSFHLYFNEEVGYEERGFAVFKANGEDWYQVQLRSGAKSWLNLPEIESQFANEIKKSDSRPSEKSWRIEKLDEIFRNGPVFLSNEYAKHATSEDLLTKKELPQKTLDRVKTAQLLHKLKNKKVDLPISYILVETSCARKSTPSRDIKSYCSMSPKVSVFEQPDLKSKNQEISMSFAHWRGELISSFESDKKTQRLYVYGEQSEFFRISIEFGENRDRVRWVRKSDLGQFLLSELTFKERVEIAAKELERNGDDSVASELRQTVFEPHFSSTGRTKWSSDGVLWVELSLDDFDTCSGKNQNSYMKLWIPYKFKFQKNALVKWRSRGC